MQDITISQIHTFVLQIYIILIYAYNKRVWIINDVAYVNIKAAESGGKYNVQSLEAADLILCYVVLIVKVVFERAF